MGDDGLIRDIFASERGLGGNQGDVGSSHRLGTGTDRSID